MTRRLSFIFILALFVSCNAINKKQLKGEWTAVQLTEEGDTLNVNLEEITLNFDDNAYQFTSTLNYGESGTYRLAENLLYTQDTLSGDALEKVVEITKIKVDSLFIRMNEGGKERLLVMKKNMD